VPFFELSEKQRKIRTGLFGVLRIALPWISLCTKSAKISDLFKKGAPTPTQTHFFSLLDK
jgi:hypothetical protein